jgi:hypothetical protein
MKIAERRYALLGDWEVRDVPPRSCTIFLVIAPIKF